MAKQKPSVNSRHVNTMADDDDDKPAKKPVEENDEEAFFAADDDDDTPKKPAKTPAKKPAVEEEEEDDEEPEDDAAEEEEEEEEPAPKPKGKAAKPKPVGAKEESRRPRTAVSREVDRKLTKKDEAKLALWNGKNRGKMLDSFFSRQAQEARKKFGAKSVFLGSEAETLVVGIPCPALAFEYVIAQDCFPLGLVMQIVAKHGVGKSGLLSEFGRWFNMAGGGMVLCENETKFNPHWYSSIMGPEVYERMQLHRCKSVEDWQRHLTWAIKQMKVDMDGTKDAPGPGRNIPVLFGVDSIMGKMSEENQEKILGTLPGKKTKGGKDSKGAKPNTGDGFAQARSFPIEAGSITKYMRTVPQIMDEWPFSLVMINHLRMKTDDNGNLERNKTGGEQVNFQESFELELKKIGGHAKKIACSEFEGVPLQLSCEKNSFGPTGRKAQVRLLWWQETDPETGRPYQKTVWDWDWATVHLLSNLMGDGGNTYLKTKLKELDFHIDCPSASDLENSAWSKTLGMTAKDAVTWSELGAMLRENKPLMDKLRDALGIARRPLLAGDYLKQIEKLSKEMP